MGRKGRWFDTVQKILSASEPDPVETEAKAAKLRDKSSFKKLWQFGKSNPSGASTSAAPAPDPEAHQSQPPPSPRPDQRQAEEVTAEVQPVETRCEKGDGVYAAEVATSLASKAGGTDAAQAAADAVAGTTVTAPRARPARSKEDIAATRIQAACRVYLARRGHQERGMARLISLVEGHAVRRQTEEALYCMQTMTRVQTQICSRRVKTEEDKKALKSQVQVKQNLDRTKIGEGWDHSLQSKEQMEAVLTMKQEAASRRQRALAYAFSHQWRNRNPSSARAGPPPMFMDPGNPNWGWTWAERWMAATRPWESQTAPDNNGRAAAKSAGRRPRVAISVQSGRSFRPPNWPSLPFPATPPPRSPSVSGRTVVAVSPRSSPLHPTSGLQRTKSLQPDRRPRSSQERPVSTPRSAVPVSPRGGGGSPRHASSSLQRAMSMQPDSRPRSSQERALSSPRHGGTNAPLRRTTSLRVEPPRRLSLGGAAAAAVSSGDDAGAPATPSYMLPTKSMRAKARCQSPSALAAADMLHVPESAPAPLPVSSPSSAKKRLSLAFADKPSSSSPSKMTAERVRRHSQPPSPRT